MKPFEMLSRGFGCEILLQRMHTHTPMCVADDLSRVFANSYASPNVIAHAAFLIEPSVTLDNSLSTSNPLSTTPQLAFKIAMTFSDSHTISVIAPMCHV